ncbi:uncharacterized protein N7529_009593 [Penicillium soppii]|uniref:uncharacterized protein n=1 Tax=Penicillium soppii TaxID=69789 RepID=UPI002549B084|nr:uncharacterized protein N7529_009593 [Penicillium soppii]KAJ5855649.1 hypothetical protein N7529_009593 [Penicillium soppii]
MAAQLRRPRPRMAGRILCQVGEERAEDGLERWHRERNQRRCDLCVLNAEHGVVGPAAVGGPLAHCDEPDAHGGDDDYAALWPQAGDGLAVEDEKEDLGEIGGEEEGCGDEDAHMEDCGADAEPVIEG